MPGRPKNSLGPLVLFHGCDKDVADSVLRGEATLQPSENDYDSPTTSNVVRPVGPIHQGAQP
jgi:hypothetical protein